MTNLLDIAEISYHGNLIDYIDSLNEDDLLKIWEAVLPFSGYSQTSFCKK